MPSVISRNVNIMRSHARIVLKVDTMQYKKFSSSLTTVKKKEPREKILIKYSTCEFYQQFATNLEIEAASLMYYAK